MLYIVNSLYIYYDCNKNYTKFLQGVAEKFRIFKIYEFMYVYMLNVFV